jgi:hypothetical protein
LASRSVSQPANSHIAIAVHLSRPHGDLVIDQLAVAVVAVSDLRPRLNTLAGDRDHVAAELPWSWRGHDPDPSSQILDLAIRSQPKRGQTSRTKAPLRTQSIGARADCVVDCCRAPALDVYVGMRDRPSALASRPVRACYVSPPMSAV